MSAFLILSVLIAAVLGGLSYVVAVRGGSPAWLSIAVALLVFGVASAFIPLAVGR